MKSKVSFESGLCKFGMGVFETIRVDEKPIELDLHMERMYNSIKELKLNIDYDKDYLSGQILDYIKDNNIKNKALRLTVFDEGFNISTRDIVYNNDSYEKGFKLTISPIKRGDNVLYRHKTTNYFENIYTKNHASNLGFDDGIFLDMNGKILECSMSNIFFIKDNKVHTPTSELPILKGTMRRRIIDLCEELNTEIIEKKIEISEIKDFDFVFISNSLMKVMKVVKIDKVTYEKENEIFNNICKFI